MVFPPDRLQGVYDDDDVQVRVKDRFLAFWILHGFLHYDFNRVSPASSTVRVSNKHINIGVSTSDIKESLYSEALFKGLK